MCATVGCEDLVVEVFDAQAQSRDADLFQRLQFRFLNRPGLTLESDFLGVLPTDVSIQTVDEITQLLIADVRRGPAAEVCKAKLPALKRGHAAVELVLFDQRVEIDLNL